MKILWCWRCETEVPMLDEDEFAVIGDLYSESMELVKSFREQEKSTLTNVSVDHVFSPLRAKYEEITGMKENNHVAIMHHRISAYGAPCKNCGKPLRTPKASVCALCGCDQDK